MITKKRDKKLLFCWFSVFWKLQIIRFIVTSFMAMQLTFSYRTIRCSLGCTTLFLSATKFSQWAPFLNYNEEDMFYRNFKQDRNAYFFANGLQMTIAENPNCITLILLKLELLVKSYSNYSHTFLKIYIQL